MKQEFHATPPPVRTTFGSGRGGAVESVGAGLSKGEYDVMRGFSMILPIDMSMTA